MKKIFLIVFFLLLNAVASMGQGTLWEMPNLTSDTTIVRYWNDGKYFVYTATQAGSRTIELHDNASGSTTSSSFPSNVNINDFRIAHDSVFACGFLVNSGEKHGLLACFSIGDFVSGSFYCNYMVFSTPFTPYGGYYTTVVEVKRLALFDDGVSTRMAFIANHYIDIPITAEYYRSGYGDAAFRSTGWDVCEYYINKDGSEIFTDICASDSKIVVAGPSCDSSLLKFQVFDKVRNFAALYGLSHSTHYGFTDHRILGKVMGTNLTGEMISLAYHYSDGTHGGLSVKVIECGTTPPSLLNSMEIAEDTATNTTWNMNDIRYDLPTDKLLVLNRIHDPTAGLGSHLFQFSNPVIALGMCQVEAYPYSKEFQALDIYSSYKYVISGMNASGNPNFFIHAIGTPSNCCAEGTALCPPTAPKLNAYTYTHHVTIVPFNTPGTYFATTYSETIDPICN